MSIYPDSDKVSVFPGIETGPLNALRLPRAGSVDYWHGEGGDPVPPTSVTREPEAVPGPPTVNVRDLAFEPGEGWRWGPLGAAVGAERLDAAVLELDPGADFGPYRYEHGRELWLFVLAGTPTVQHAEGERALSPGDLACLLEGPTGGRSVLNQSSEAAHVLLLWTAGFPAAVCYPETGEWVLRSARGADELRHLSGVVARAPAKRLISRHWDRFRVVASVRQVCPPRDFRFDKRHRRSRSAKVRAGFRAGC